MTETLTQAITLMQKRFIKNVMQRFLPPTMTITGRFSWD